MADTDKTEDPTSTKLADAREKGDVARSREFSNFFVFLGCIASLSFLGKTILQGLVKTFEESFQFQASTLNSTKSFLYVIEEILGRIVWIVGPFMVGVALFSVAGYLGQFGLLWTTEKLRPDFTRLNPLQGLKRLFAKETFVEFAKASLKVICISFILYVSFRGEASHILELGLMPVQHIFGYSIDLLEQVFLVVLIFLAALGTADFVFQKWAYWQRMKMSLQEVKDEFKNKEGDPMVKSRIRQIQRDRARARMMEEVPKANVVVTNPTHVAVALKYERTQMRAPIVIAKGAGYIAVKIKEIAAQNQVPIVEKRELARYLYRHVEIRQAIPEDLYTAVAEVLAYVYRIKQKFRSYLREQTI